jgi:hypothetical protein
MLPAERSCTAASNCAGVVITPELVPTESVDHSAAAGAESKVHFADPKAPTEIAASASVEKLVNNARNDNAAVTSVRTMDNVLIVAASEAPCKFRMDQPLNAPERNSAFY